MALVIWTDDVNEAYRQLVAEGVPARQPPQDAGNNNRNALLRDADGNLVEIVAPRARPGQARPTPSDCAPPAQLY
jgi:lactoylglutathione lyase